MFQTSKLPAFILFSFSIFAFSCSPNETRRVTDPAGVGPLGKQNTLPSALDNLDALDLDVESDQAKLKPILETGKKAVDWLNLVNSHRDPAARLNIADKSTKNPVSPENPNVISVASMIEKHQTRLEALPPKMKTVVLDDQPLPDTPPVADDVFIKNIRELNSSYQSAIRWLGQAPYMNYYIQNAHLDIRGLYFLQKENDLNSQLKSFATLAEEKKMNFKNWLIGVCFNSRIKKDLCTAELDRYITTDRVFQYYQKYYPQAKRNWDEFFTLMPVRKELKWNGNKTIMTQKFILPTIQKVADWLKFNVEEEWVGESFKLLLTFVPDNGFSPFIEFLKGVTPHVAGETANKIVMDPDYSLDDYDTQWTIRHEFGHVLGFPDCYLEFFDQKSKSMTYYTIEPDNLMCAWGGKLQPKHINELRRAYN